MSPALAMLFSSFCVGMVIAVGILHGEYYVRQKKMKTHGSPIKTPDKPKEKPNENHRPDREIERIPI